MGALWIYGCVGDSAVIPHGPYSDHRYLKPRRSWVRWGSGYFGICKVYKGGMERPRFRLDLLRKKVNEDPQM